MGSLKSSTLKVLIRGAMFLLYLFAGAGIFLLLEKDDQQEMRNNALQELVGFESALINSTQGGVTDSDMKRLRDLAERAIEVGALGKRRFLTEWNLGNAFFFCGNVITTIGYGHITPHTIGGRAVMVLYALFGISLTGFFLRTVGNELTSLIAYLIKIYERRLMNREAEKLEIKCAVVSMVLVLFMLLLGAIVFSATEKKWTFIDAFYYCFVSLTTIGFGDLVPGEWRNGEQGQVETLFIELASLVYYVLGLSIMSGVIVAISGVIEEKTKKLDIGDPMDAIRNLRIENLNSKAMKKLGYKVDENIRMPPKMMKSSVNTERRGTIVPDDDDDLRGFTPAALARSRTSLQNRIALLNERMNNLNASSKSIQSSLSNTPVKSKGDFNKTSTTLNDEIHCNKNADQSNNMTPLKTTKSSFQSLYETDEKGCEQKNMTIESKLESGLYYTNNSNIDHNNSEEKDTATKKNSTVVEGGFEPWNSDNNSDNSDNPKRYTYSKERMFTLQKSVSVGNTNPTTKTLFTTTYRTNSLSDMNVDIHRKISNERSKPKRLRKHSSLKEFKIQYSSNLQTVKQRDKIKTKCHQKEGKRVGLPAELFANDVSFTVKKSNRSENTPCNTPPARLKPPSANKADNINGSFYSISNSSPVSSYSNPYFQSDDVIYSSPLLPSSTSSLDMCRTAAKTESSVASNNTGNIKQGPGTSDFTD